MMEAAVPTVANALFSPEPASPAFVGLDAEDKYLDVFARDLLMQAGSTADWDLPLPQLDIAGMTGPVSASPLLGPQESLAGAVVYMRCTARA